MPVFRKFPDFWKFYTDGSVLLYQSIGKTKLSGYFHPCQNMATTLLQVVRDIVNKSKLCNIMVALLFFNALYGINYRL